MVASTSGHVYKRWNHFLVFDRLIREIFISNIIDTCLSGYFDSDRIVKPKLRIPGIQKEEDMSNDKSPVVQEGDEVIARPLRKVKWYRSTFYNATILGLCSFAAPGLWGAMNSLGAGGAATPELVNSANALTFCLMILSCYFSSILVKYIGIRGALCFGTIGFAPYSAGLYTNNRFGTEWLVLFGAALCGISAGVFWMSEAAIAIAYPEPWNRGKVLGYWLSYTLFGQVLGGAINLGLNSDRGEAGAVSYKVYLVFIVLQALGPFVALLLTPPRKAERTDGVEVKLEIYDHPLAELKEMAREFLSKNFLLLILFIGQGVYAEAVYFTYLALWFTVRARALGSFLSAIVTIISINVLGAWLDRKKIPLKTRARGAFWVIVILQGAWWLWATVNVTRYVDTHPTYDWSDSGFGAGFAVFIFLRVGFQFNYMLFFFIITNLAENEQQVIRYSALLRGTESAWQALSYGLGSLWVFASVGGVYLNFGLWAVSIFPAWLVIKGFGKETFPIRPEEQLRAPISQEVGSKADVQQA